MSKSLIQVANQSSQTVANNSIISLGSVLRRFGCNCRLTGNAIEVNGAGYYTIDCAVTVEPTSAGEVSVALFNNGVQITGAIATGSTTTAGNPVTLPITTWTGNFGREEFHDGIKNPELLLWSPNPEARNFHDRDKFGEMVFE